VFVKFPTDRKTASSDKTILSKNSLPGFILSNIWQQLRYTLKFMALAECVQNLQPVRYERQSLSQNLQIVCCASGSLRVP
jgi:hypothetical protein